MAGTTLGIIPYVVRQHADDATLLWIIRSRLASAPHVKLHHLRRFDDRLLAHLDGLATAGEEGRAFCEEGLQSAGAAPVFVAGVRAIEDGEPRSIERLVSLAGAVPESVPGLLSAFGWVETPHLRGTVARMLKSDEPFERMVAVAACAMHRVDPGAACGRWLTDPNDLLRGRVLRAAGEVGRIDLASPCAARILDDNADCRFWAAWSAVLLGNRGAALDVLASIALTREPHAARACQLALQAMDVADAHSMLQELARNPENLRWLIRGSGIAGDPVYVPWLIGRMASDDTARLAAEALSLITGADLALLDLERKPPEDFESGPNDDPDDPNVETDPDDGLPWPDQDRVRQWWADNSGRFEAGTRYFVGAHVTREQCLDVLRTGYQRQRELAAHYLCFLQPATPLFNVHAPAWRQQELLGRPP